MTKSHPDPSDLQTTLASLKEIVASPAPAPWLVLDGYHFDSAYQQAIRASGQRLLVIDDMAHLPHYHVDLLLNQNINADRLSYHCDVDTKLLLGTGFSMLRAEFLSWCDWQREISEVGQRVLVSLGGSDPHNMTLRVIQALQQSETKGLEARIVLGPAKPHLPELCEAVAAWPNLKLLRDPPDLPELMAWADIVISAAGSTCWELAFMGLPSILIVLARNQLGIAEGLHEASAAINLGWHDAIAAKDAVEVIDKLLLSFDARRNLSRRSRSLVDGNGGSRVVEALASE